MASEHNSSLAAKHMHIWGYAAQAVSHFMSVERRHRSKTIKS